MHIFNDVRAVKERGLTTIYINPPSEFIGMGDDPNKANLNLANRVGWDNGVPENWTPKDVYLNCGSSELDRRIENFQRLWQGEEEGEVILADNEIRLRGYGAGLCISTEFPDGRKRNTPVHHFLFPYRDLGAPGDRLVWDTCSGRTTSKNESYSWLDLMIQEGVEELVLTAGDKLVLYNIEGVNPAFAPTMGDANSIIRENAKKLGIKTNGETFVNLEYTYPDNAPRIVETLASGAIHEFYAMPVIESQFSGLELVANGVITFPGRVDPRSLGVYAPMQKAMDNILGARDGEMLPNGEPLDREIHRIHGQTGEVTIFRGGNNVSETTIDNVVEGRKEFVGDSDGRGQVPAYSATAKAAMMTDREYLLFEPYTNVLDKISFGNSS